MRGLFRDILATGATHPATNAADMKAPEPIIYSARMPGLDQLAAWPTIYRYLGMLPAFPHDDLNRPQFSRSGLVYFG